MLLILNKLVTKLCLSKYKKKYFKYFKIRKNKNCNLIFTVCIQWIELMNTNCYTPKKQFGHQKIFSGTKYICN